MHSSPEALRGFYRFCFCREHIQVFQGMLGEADKYQPSGESSEEESAYIQALVDNAAFTDDMVISELANQADSDVEALELAISGEKDSILFYYEMREIIPHRAQPTVNNIIKEEKSHVKMLTEIKKRISTD